MNDFYDTYLGTSSVVLDSWFNGIKAMLYDFFMLILYVLVCWIIYKITINIAQRLLKAAKINQLNVLYEKIEVLKKLNLKIDFQKLFLAIIKLFLILIFVVIGADIFSFPGVTRVVNDIIDYLPKLISAIGIILLGFYLANKVKQWLSNILNLLGNNSGSVVISNVLVFGIILFFSLMGLNQAGIDTSLITNNISIILGVTFAAIALSFGLGSKDIVREILYSYYLRKNIQIGDKIRINDEKVEGTLIAIDNINVKILTANGNVILYPIKKFVVLKIEILNQ
ncbi:hypothetical protein NU10_12985 [Flavobacterium dauae]|uniref:mechanosensitive ion channel family protein n=1 Tax=Flavobacterium dauae TaxID=1563479 RepID=UPI00101B4CD2|nr:hypothetical protein [Flavobacterium dauae]WLD23605.1 hypothetical protein NU10_12985 [Flavobacterium dauae]